MQCASVCVPEHALFGLTLRAESHPRLHHKHARAGPSVLHAPLHADSRAYTPQTAHREAPWCFQRIRTVDCSLWLELCGMLAVLRLMFLSL